METSSLQRIIQIRQPFGEMDMGKTNTEYLD